MAPVEVRSRSLPEGATVTGRLEWAVYTDCRPGEGLSGTAGLGFQAATSGAEPEVREIARNQLLYEPSPDWMRRQRPVGDYPPSLAHTHANGWYATAAGTYLGKEAKGSRQGNHLTHAVMSRDPGAYDLIRPAQLAGAHFWLAEPLPDGHIAVPIPDGWEPGSLDTDEVARRVRATADGEAVLTAMLSALHDRQRRIVVISADTTEILTWIAAATLLTPQHLALRTTFKVHTLRPAHGTHHIVGVHPEALNGLSIDQPMGMHIIDLRDMRTSPIDPDDVCAQWVKLLSSEDVLDVVDAVELAAQTRLEPAPAAALARAAFFGHVPPLQHTPGLAAWLKDSPPEQHRAYGGSVTDALLSHPQRPHRLLEALDELAVKGRLDTEAARIRTELLHAEGRQLADGRQTDTRPLPPLPPLAWTTRDTHMAVNHLNEILCTASSDRFAPVLALAARFGLPVDPATTAPEATARFIGWWADHPEIRPDPTHGPAGESLRRALHTLLAERCIRQPHLAERLGRQWHGIVLTWFPEPVIEDPLYRACIGALMTHAPPQERARCLERHLRGTTVKDAAAVTAMLWRWTRPDYAELRVSAPLLPPGTPMDQAYFDDLTTALLDKDATPDGAVLELATELNDRALLDDIRLTGVLDLHQRMTELATTSMSERAVELLLYEVHRLAPQMARHHGTTIVDVLLTRRLPRSATRLLRILASADRDDFAARLTRRLKTGGDGYDLYCAFMTLERGLSGRRLHSRLLTAFHERIRRADQRILHNAEATAAEVEDGWRRALHAHIAAVPRSARATVWPWKRS